MTKLAELSSFGGIDADSDPLLDDCFEDHEAYISARDADRFLIIGRKGSGKTAIFRKILRTKEPDVFPYGHTFRDYPWHHHDKQKRVGVPEHECFAHSWKYLCLITLAKMLLNHDNSQPWDEFSLNSLAALETFVIDTYGSKDPDVSQVFQPATKLKLNAKLGLKLPAIEASVSPQVVAMNDLPSVVQEVNGNLLDKVVRSLNPEHKYYVLFDELDLGFSNEDANYSLRLKGLIHAARDINLYAKDVGRSLNVIVFLRDDIYERLKFEDKNKITEAGVSRIEWDSPRTTHTLKEIMSRRIGSLLQTDSSGAWEKAFDEDNRMRSSQTKYQHIIDRTMLRPRDMIKFCNEILRSYKLAGHTSEKFENLDVNNAFSEYSKYLAAELEDEIFKHIPHHENVFELLRDLDSVQFDLGVFEQICAQRKDLVPEGKTPKGILTELFEFSIVGYYQLGGAGYGGAEFVFRYKSPQAKFNTGAKSFQVHLGLSKALALKRYRRSSTESGEASDGGESGDG